MLIYIVILHYQNIEDTINCVNSIKNLNAIDNYIIKILIIDNNSPNDSGIKLKEKYENNKDVEVMLLEKNFGFSKANNIGYKYCKEKKADLIMIINNDIIFEDKKFMEKLFNISLEKNNHEIIIPDVINYDGYHQNPMKLESATLANAYKNYYYKKTISLLLNIPLLNKALYKVITKREKKWFEKYNNEYNLRKMNVKDFFVPIGAFIIYTKNWIEKEDIAFPSNTFMFMEEDFLALYVKKKNYRMLYDEKLKIRHLEGRSTNSISKKTYNVLMKKAKMQSDALKNYILYLKKNKE